MSKVEFNGYSSLFIGDVLLDRYGVYGVKVLQSVYLDEAGGTRWILQTGQVQNNTWKGDKDGVVLESRSSMESDYSHKWTKNVIEIKKGDVFKDKDGNYFVAESTDKAWNLTQGTWAGLTIVGETIVWSKNYSNVTLTEVKTVAGKKFSTNLG